MKLRKIFVSVTIAAATVISILGVMLFVYKFIEAVL